MNKSEIEKLKSELSNLELGNEDVRIELLRKLNIATNGNPNKTDQQLIQEYYFSKFNNVETGLPFEQMRNDAICVINAEEKNKLFQKILHGDDLACHVLALLDHIDEIDGIVKLH